MGAKDQLIEAASQLLWERGYVGTSPAAVLERSGVGQGSLYHHFAGKSDLAIAAMEHNAESLVATAEAQFSGPGTAVERISRWLLREREVLRGCPIGSMAQDADVVAAPELRAPVERTLAWLQGRVTQLLEEGEAAGELAGGIKPAELAAALVAVLQGSYVLARAADSPDPFHRAIAGIMALLAAATAER
ncbi:TetR/AcrR family transcriptional regulator [Cryobacterium sp. W22_MBD10_FK3]|uniref:TetR/AcrR family transcriptional regulator n=1 Tax=Cryobacterium sp. W22_MBD10_FK3 TaxID=3240273 RepID=UPI003F8EB8D4